MRGRQRRPLPRLVWHWRKELAILAMFAMLGIAVAETFGYACLIVGLSIMAAVLSPPWSQQLRAWLWYLFTPHLLRSGMFHACIQNRHGRQPLILRITREAFGERVLLRCPPGVCAEDIEDVRDILRATCHAADIGVVRDELRSHLVTVDVIRWPEHAEPQHGYRA